MFYQTVTLINDHELCQLSFMLTAIRSDLTPTSFLPLYSKFIQQRIRQVLQVFFKLEINGAQLFSKMNNDSGAKVEVKAEVDLDKSIEFWSDLYETEKAFWQMNCVNPILIENLMKLTEGKKSKIFVPLAGKSVDLPYLIQEGHCVFAVEVVKKAIEELDKENKLGLKFDEKRSIYFTEDERLVIYCGDFFECPVEQWGPFDCVWDRGSFVAIEYELRGKYKDVMQRALSTRDDQGRLKYHNFRYLLSSFDYDKEQFGGPPRSVSEADMEEYFGDWTQFQTLKKFQDPVSNKHLPRLPSDAFRLIYFITPK